MASLQKSPKATGWPGLECYRARESFPKQFQAVTSKARFIHICAAIRTGKTYGAARAFMLQVVKDRKRFGGEPLLYWVMGPTYKQTIAQKRQLIDLIPGWEVDWRRQGDAMSFWNTSRGDGVVYLKGNVQIECRSAQDPESLIADKLRGFWVTEAARVKLRALQNLDGRIANYIDGWGIYDTSPFGHCPYYVSYAKPAKEGKTPNASYHEWTAYESPYITKEKIAEAQARMLPSYFRRDFLASWDTFQGQIYSEWEQRIHVRSACPFTPDRAIVAADINTADTAPAAYLVLLVSGRALHVRAHVESEYYRFGLGLDFDGYASAIHGTYTELRQRFRDVQVIIDPSMHNAFKNMLRAKGIEPRNAKNQVLAGIRTMGGALHPAPSVGPALTVSETCKNFANEIRGYAWKVSPDGATREAPDKGMADHLMDCCRYACMEVFSGYEGAKQVR